MYYLCSENKDLAVLISAVQMHVVGFRKQRLILLYK